MAEADSYITCWYGQVANMIFEIIKTIGLSQMNNKTGWMIHGMITPTSLHMKLPVPATMIL